MSFNYSKLRGRIVELFDSQAKFSSAMAWSERTTSLKLNGERSWKQPDIYKAMKLLDLCEDDIPEYFFTPKVQNNELQERKENK